MKSFSKIVIAFVCVSFFMAAPIFAEEYVYNIPANRSSANTLAAASSSQVLGPYAASALEWVDSDSAKVYLTDSSGKGVVVTLKGPSTGLFMFSSAFSSQAIVYLFVDSSNQLTNIGFIL